MANLENWTRCRPREKPEPKWCESLCPGQALQRYGRSICFRVADLERKKVFEFYCIPFDFDDNQPRNLYDGEEQPPSLPTGIHPFQTSGYIPWLSTFAAVGSSLFCFGGESRTDSGSGVLPSSAIYRYPSCECIRGRWYTYPRFRMICARYEPQIIDLRVRKVLVIGGIGRNRNLEDDDSWAEFFDPYCDSCIPESSLPIKLRGSPRVVTADLRSCNQILVASTFSNAAFVCDVTTLMWEIFDQSDEFVFGKGTGHSQPLSHVEGKAAVVRDTILCWFGFRGDLLRAYDLNLKMWFEKPIEGLKKVGKLMPDQYDNDFSLLPLDHEHICLLWFDHSPYAPETLYSVLHCMKVLVSIDYAREHPMVRASVISFRSYVLNQNACQIKAVVLERNAFETTALRDTESKEGRAAAMATTKAVGKRKRKTGSTKGEPKLFFSLKPEQHGRTICFRAAQYSTRSIDFYCIPVDDDLNHAANDSQPPELYVTPPEHIFPFQSSTNISESSSFAAVGKSMYCVGGHAKGKASSAIYRFDTTGGYKGFWYPNPFDLCCPRVAPSTIVIDGKLFIIGAHVVSEGAPLAEVFDPSSKSSLIVESPLASFHESLYFVTAALLDRNQILVACTYARDAYLLDVKTGAWVQVDHNIDFAAVSREAAVVLKTTLCWCDYGLQMLLAYDLNLKRWFKTSIKHLKRVGRRLKDKELSKFSLFTLDENHLCLLWVDHVEQFLLHCTKVGVSLSDNRFRAAVASSRSYVLRDGSSFIDGLLLS
ncbi:hypothetical protein Vadar_026414 [Vaccinium darrowii]|uniref:Uncharacterized protein n=1 Tax=Vaccinium darrowii TaxID=229202 RepID=A0ACB7YPL2_9ERIC|nr:hypothetical protein Vadar_026414 [Vaccinium darrowii]